ncbi:uncharacterized protein LOC132924014 [Rhopalosiphum padi]|uniref:uncharacterized protein LOC132924014 n=1 Tax=Rhopalosiphum padi TaxID=40932 RepID=UPI00298DD54D|nr:uncharacterized protein LOC132924014 [Rhopalosiphum padi]XP_060844054.1 uncharacterized protein LOC132924014 [Rhopalosiphum padi]
MSDDDILKDNYNFAEGDDVFVYFNDLLYEAKCVKRRKTDYGENQYFIHYKGWKTTWDEWIDENEVLEMSYTNYGHQARLQKKFDEKRALEESKKKKKIEKPKKTISVGSLLKKRGRPRKTVTKRNSPCPLSVKNKKKPSTSLADKTLSQTNKNLQKRGQSKKAEPKSNSIDKDVKDKIKVTNDDTITKNIPSSSTMASSSEVTKNVKTYTNKAAKKITNEVIQDIRVTEPSESTNIDYSNEFQPEYEPVLKRLKTYTKNKLTDKLQVNVTDIFDDTTKNIEEPVAEKALISEPSQPVNIDLCKVSNDATTSDSVQEVTQITEPSQLIVEDDTTKENIDEEALKEEAAIRACSNIFLEFIPFSVRLGDKLHQSLILPNKIRKVMMDDWLMHNRYKKIPKFQDVHYVANIANAFIEELYKSEDDRQKQTSMMVSVKLMECFNNIVHTHVTYKSEIKNGIQFKAMTHFRKRLVDQPNTTYVFKEHIVPKKIWCYVYGPIYLLRFLVRLPYVILTNTWNVQCHIDFFINYVNKMMQFLDDNVDTYFSSIDYVE